MKKGVMVFLFLVVCLGFHVTDVSADLIFEPQNAFYKLHANKCEYVNHIYTVNGYGGKTELYKSQLSDKVMVGLIAGACDGGIIFVLCFVAFLIVGKVTKLREQRIEKEMLGDVEDE